MAEYQILSWHEIHAQIRVKDDEGRVQFELSPRFQQKIDEEAMKRGLAGSDEYLEGWKWGKKVQREGSAKEVAEALRQELEAAFEQ